VVTLRSSGAGWSRSTAVLWCAATRAVRSACWGTSRTLRCTTWCTARSTTRSARRWRSRRLASLVLILVGILTLRLGIRFSGAVRLRLRLRCRIGSIFGNYTLFDIGASCSCIGSARQWWNLRNLRSLSVSCSNPN